MPVNNTNKIFSWPDHERFSMYIKWVISLAIIFAMVYPTCNYYASLQKHQYHLYTEWELSLPLVPWMLVVYMSYLLMLIEVLFVLKTTEAIKGLGQAFLFALFVAALVFMIFPGKLGYIRPDEVPGYEYYFNTLYMLDKPHNLYPSLHITYSSLCVMTMIQQSRNRLFNFLMVFWLLMISLSVLLVHQHHLFDIVSGLILGYGVFKWVYLRKAYQSN